MVRSFIARHVAEDFDARLAGIVIGTDCPLLGKIPGGPQIHEHRLNSQDTCSKIPGRVFSEGAEAPQAITTSRTVLGDPETGNKCNLLVDMFYMFQKCRLFKVSILKS